MVGGAARALFIDGVDVTTWASMTSAGLGPGAPGGLSCSNASLADTLSYGRQTPDLGAVESVRGKRALEGTSAASGRLSALW